MTKELMGALKAYFGYDAFREPQESIIKTILEGKDVIGILPTGTGKSLCFQLPSIFFPNMTLVLSPLVALIEDQVSVLNERGIPTIALTSHLTPKQMRIAIEEIADEKYKVVYLSPEKLFSEDFNPLLQTLPIDHIAIDEAHCVSQWGHDFRPKYKKIGKVLKTLPKKPILSAFTATANDQVLEDIYTYLGLEAPVLFRTSFDRPNLFMDVKLYEDKTKWVLNYVQKKEKGSRGLIYCSTRNDVEKISEKLLKKGVAAGGYHAGLKKKERAEVQAAFFNNEYDVLVATNAFGMGMDKADIRYVIHYNMPSSMEAYYQEIGRAGRDGKASECMLLFGPKDVPIQNFLTKQRVYFRWRLKEKEEWIQEMVDYVHTKACYRAFILNHFNEPIEPCGCCGNCKSHYVSVDKTIDAQKILSATYYLKQQYTQAVLIDVLKGKNSKKVKDNHLHKLSVFGIMKGVGDKPIRLLIDDLVSADYLCLDKHNGLGLLPKAVDALKTKEPILILTKEP